MSKGAAFLAFVCAAALLFVALVVLWLGQTTEKVYTDGADALVIRAVLRTDTDAVAAENLAVRVREQVPEASIEVINEAMGRSLLALQEPWIAQMPDFEVTPLPTLLEIRHPDLLTQPSKVAAFVEALGQEPEVDFVAYNETAHDKLVKLATASSSIESHALWWLLCALVVAGLAAQTACWSLVSPRSIFRTVLSATLVWIAAWAVAWLVYRGWEATAVASGDWQRLGSGVHFSAGIISGIGIAATSLAGWALRRLR